VAGQGAYEIERNGNGGVIENDIIQIIRSILKEDKEERQREREEDKEERQRKREEDKEERRRDREEFKEVIVQAIHDGNSKIISVIKGRNHDIFTEVA
jgi:hypothetical protein